MAKFQPTPPESALAKERDVWQETTTIRERIRTIVMELHDPATAKTIAERAHCSSNAARSHLADFVELGIVKEDEQPSGTRYVRNEAYIRWRQANELATSHTIPDLLDELSTLETTHEQYQEQFDVSLPSRVEIPVDATHAKIEAILTEISEWETVLEAIDRHREAIRLARRHDDGLTA